jgi:hypothetical protein
MKIFRFFKIDECSNKEILNKKYIEELSKTLLNSEFNLNEQQINEIAYIFTEFKEDCAEINNIILSENYDRLGLISDWRKDIEMKENEFTIITFKI